MGALSSAGTANATCASVSGIGNGGDCTSTVGSVAVGIGPDATTPAATASGVFNRAVSFGYRNTATAGSTGPTLGNNTALGLGVSNTATAGPTGRNQIAAAVGIKRNVSKP